VKEVVIQTYEKPLVEKDEGSGGRLSKEEIKKAPTRSVTELVNLTAGTVGNSFKGQRSEGTAYYIIDVTKESVTVSGSTKYNGVGKANITVLFSKDSQISGNTAVSKSVKTNSNGNYTTELTPGSYNVSVAEVVNESGQNITYTGNAGQIILTSGDAPRVLNILLTREQSP
jgi:hypothetical protein